MSSQRKDTGVRLRRPLARDDLSVVLEEGAPLIAPGHLLMSGVSERLGKVESGVAAALCHRTP
jgi:hypothetical protein